MLKPLRLWLMLICGLLMASQTYALEVEVAVDRNPVIVNEAFNLTVTANDDLPRWAFNSRALLQDFIVGSTSIDSSSMTSQGVTQRTTRWTVRLTARSAGTYTIPSFTIEGVQTAPLEIEVIEAQQSANGENRPFFIEATVDNQNPYVQQQVRYTVDLYIHADIPLESGTIAPPFADNAEVEQITQNRERQEIINGQRYQVITQVYAITPQRSGSLVLQGAQFEGLYRQLNPRSFSGFARPEQVSLATPTQTLTVNPIPANYSGQWLVSEQVVVERVISPSSGMVGLGEPITETITITAEGVRPEQIPELSLNTPSGIRSYPERPQQELFARGDTRIGKVTYSTVYIPSAEGTYTLPEVRVPWFNPRKEQREISVAAAETLTITPTELSSETTTQPSSQVQDTTSAVRQVNASSEARNTEELSNTPVISATGIPKLWFFTVLAIWLITMLSGFLYIRKLRVRKIEPQIKVPESARASLNALKQACANNNAQEMINQLVAWQRARDPNHGTLAKFKEAFRHDTALCKELRFLEAALYSADKQAYQRGKSFWKAFSHRHKVTHHEQPHALYPQGQ